MSIHCQLGQGISARLKTQRMSARLSEINHLILGAGQRVTEWLKKARIHFACRIKTENDSGSQPEKGQQRKRTEVREGSAFNLHSHTDRNSRKRSEETMPNGSGQMKLTCQLGKRRQALHGQ